MNAFPFAAVHDYIFHQLVQTGLPASGIFRPMLLLAKNDGGAIQTNLLPSIDHFFHSSNSKDTLGQVIRKIVPLLLFDTCLVMISEAWCKTVAPGAQQPPRKGSLEHDPDAESIIMLMFYRPGITQHSRFPIKAGQPVYAPFDDQSTKISGRLSLNPGNIA